MKTRKNVQTDSREEFSIDVLNLQQSNLRISDKINLLIACHWERDNSNTIRIISARKETKNEGEHYHKGH